MITVSKFPIASPDQDKLKAWASGTQAALAVSVAKHKIAAIQAGLANALVEIDQGQELKQLTADEALVEIRSLQSFVDVLDRLGKDTESLTWYKLDVNP